MSQNYDVRYSPSSLSREELFQQILKCMYQLDADLCMADEGWCYELQFSRGRWDGGAPIAFSTYAEALAGSRGWQGVCFWFYCNGGDLPLTILDNATEGNRTVILMESSMPYTSQCEDKGESLRWRTFLFDVANAIDADFYLMQCDADHETIRKEEFIHLLFSPAFRERTDVPIVTAFHERLVSDFPTELIVPDCHRSQRWGSYMEIVDKNFGMEGQVSI